MPPKRKKIQALPVRPAQHWVPGPIRGGSENGTNNGWEFPAGPNGAREFRWEPGKRLAENGTFVVTRLGKLKEMGVFLRLFSNCRDVLGCKWGVSPWEQVHEMSLVPSEMIGKSCKGPRRGEMEIPNFWPHQTGWTCCCWNWQDVQ